MAKKNMIADAMKALKGVFSAVAALNFEVAVQEDGTELQYSVIEVDAPVFVAGPDGSEPAPDGEYKIDELTSVKVAGGVITEVVKAPETAPEDVVVEAADDDTDAPEADADLDVELVPEDEPAPSIEDLVAALVEGQKTISDALAGFDSRIKALEDKVNGVAEAQEEVAADVEEIQSEFAKFSKQPAKGSKLKADFALQLDPNRDANKEALQRAFTSLKRK